MGGSGVSAAGNAGMATGGSGASGAGGVGLGGVSTGGGGGLAGGTGGGGPWVGSGTISYERWEGVKGEAVGLVPVSETPTVTLELARFQMPDDVGLDFGARVRGFLTAPVTATTRSSSRATTTAS